MEEIWMPSRVDGHEVTPAGGRVDAGGPRPRPIRRREAVPVFENSFGTLFNDVTVGPRGDPGRYLRWEWSHDGVVVVPTRRDEVAVWSMYRYPISATSLEFPRGGVDAGESLESAAIRELKEETGLTGSSPRCLGHLQAESGLIASRVTVVAVQVDERLPATADVEPMESVATEPAWLASPAFAARVGDGGITCAITIAAWAMLLALPSEAP
jgi:ADP-ribose pyrophosphatase